jgi:methionyl-tRNA formyltransferase
MLRLVFFGTPEFAVPSLKLVLAGPHDVVGIVTQPDRPRGRGQRVVASPVKQLALAHHLPIWQPERMKDEAFLKELAAVRPDLGVVAAYGRIIPDALLAIPRLGIINVHASLLPAWRGASPVHHAVMAGDAETGVTIMRVVRQLDAGPMLARAVRPIAPEETSEDVERDLSTLGASLLPEVLDALEAGQAHEEPQDETRVTFAPRLAKADGILDWSLPAQALANRVRGLHPWPLASSVLGDGRILILRARPAVVAHDAVGGPPGTVTDTRDGRLIVATGSGTAVEILQLQPEGRRAMTAREFLAGHHLGSGARFTRPES